MVLRHDVEAENHPTQSALKLVNAAHLQVDYTRLLYHGYSPTILNKSIRTFWVWVLSCFALLFERL